MLRVHEWRWWAVSGAQGGGVVMRAVSEGRSALAGLGVVVTAGGTQQPLDDVRYIANASTGRFGARLAEECLRRGAHVRYVHGRGALLPLRRRVGVDLSAGAEAAVAAVRALPFECPPGTLRLHETRTVEQVMTTLEALLTAGDQQVIIHAMAVSDYSAPAQVGKIASDHDELTLRLRRTPKVIGYLKRWAPPIVQVGFKLLSGVSDEQLHAAGLASGLASGSDLTIANDLRRISAQHHPVLAIWPDGRSTSLINEVERGVVDLIEQCLAQRAALGDAP